MITITINDKIIKLDRPVTVLAAAESNGIKIPHFCSYPILERFGGCRMCLVEIDKMPRLQTSCTIMVTEGMVVRTESAQIAVARKAVLEFLLINHPLDCGVCDKAGECDLQDYTMLYGASDGRFEEKKMHEPESLKDPLISRNMERCIVCTRCVRMCDGVQGASALSVTGRGVRTFIEPFSGERFDCEYCGNCLTVCPVGAIMSRLHRHAFRPWQIEKDIETVCPYCGVGCILTLQIRENKIVRAKPIVGKGVNNGILCARGYFGYEYVASPERLTTPLIRKNGTLVPVGWDEAFDYISTSLKSIKEKHGGKAIAGIASARCTNEDNYLFQKLMRAGLGTNNIDSIARMGYAGALSIVETLLGPGATSNMISGIENSDSIIVMGADPTSLNPVLGVRIRGAFKRGAKVVTIGHMPGLAKHRSLSLAPDSNNILDLLNATISGLAGQRSYTGNNEIIKSWIASATQGRSGDNANAEFLGIMQSSASSCLVIGPDIANHPDGAECIGLMCVLAALLDARVYLLSEKPNEQGAIDMGCVPDMLTGGVSIARGQHELTESVWGVKVPRTQGLTLLEIMGSIADGNINALYVLGENPAFNLPDAHRIALALGALDLLIVQDIFMTETAQMAHVVLPAASWAEKSGTYTNLERRMQILHKGIEGDTREDWMIIAEIGKRLGVNMEYHSPRDIMAEISRVSPLHAKLTYDDIEKGMDMWPYKGQPAMTAMGDKCSIVFQQSARERAIRENNNPIIFMLDKPLFHSGSLSRHSDALNSIQSGACARMAKETAAGLGLTDGKKVEIFSKHVTLSVPLNTDDTVPGGTVMLTNNFKGYGALGLFEYVIDPITKAPILRGGNISVREARS